MTSELPSFDHPPLVETATSLQFGEIRELLPALQGVFWDKFMRSAYPKLRVLQTIPPQHEHFVAGQGRLPIPTLRISDTIPTRLQMIASSDDMMVQVQNDRIVFNWMRRGDTDYPRWERTIAAFRKVWEDFSRFLGENELGNAVPTQWEVAYVNALKRGVDWDSPSDWPRLLPALFGTFSAANKLTVDAISMGLRLQIGQQIGRLYVEVKHATPEADGTAEEVLILQLTARGPVSGEKRVETAMDMLELGRECIVQSFALVTGPEAQKRWGRTT